MNLNSATNFAIQLVAFNLYKIENVPGIAKIDGTEDGEKCYERVVRAYHAMAEASKKINDGGGNANVVWGKFSTDAVLGTDWIDASENNGEQYGRSVPQLRQQYLGGSPSVLAEDYEDMKTGFGTIPSATLGQLAPLYVQLQSY